MSNLLQGVIGRYTARYPLPALSIDLALAEIADWRWVPYSNPIVPATGPEPYPHAQTIAVGGRGLHMFYMTGANGPGANYGPTHYIGLTLPGGYDLFDWTPGTNNPVFDHGGAGAWDENECMIMAVDKRNGTVYALYTGSDVATGTSKVGLATATDWGEVFSRSGSNPILSAPSGYGGFGPLHEAIWQTRDGVWHMLVRATHQVTQHIWLFEAHTTSNHNDWTDWEITPEPLCDWCEVMVGLGYGFRGTSPMSLYDFGSLWLIGFEQTIGFTLGRRWVSGMVASRDLKNWVMAKYPTAVSCDIPGVFFESGVSNPTLFRWRDQMVMISGFSYAAGANWCIGIGYLDKGKFALPVLRLAILAAAATSALADSAFIFQQDEGHIILTVECTYHGAAAAGGKLRIYTSPGNTANNSFDFDTEPVEAAITLAFAAGQTRRQTLIPCDAAQKARFLKVTIENLDAGQAITDIKVTATVGN